MFVAKKNYKNSELAPILSEETLEYHFGKHHVGYANMLNSLVRGTDFEQMSLNEIVMIKDFEDKKIFNNAAQIFNHDFYWSSLAPASKNNAISNSKISQLIDGTFGDTQKFFAEYIGFASQMFGSGWSWIVLESDEKLGFCNTQNADSPIVFGKKPLLVIDLWEHAYYIDYRNDRKAYVEAIVNNCLNFDFAESNLISYL